MIKLPENYSEAQLQAWCFTELWNQVPQMRGLFFAITNNSEHVGRAMQRKAVGLVAGVADTCLLWNGRAYFFEFKTLTGRQSEKQIKWEIQCRKQNIFYDIVRTPDEFIKHIKKITGHVIIQD